VVSQKEALALQFSKGLIAYQRQWYLGFRRMLLRWEKELEAYSVTWMNTAQDILIMFDKVSSVCCCWMFSHKSCFFTKIPTV
jgi:hypothetical protein